MMPLGHLGKRTLWSNGCAKCRCTVSIPTFLLPPTPMKEMLGQTSLRGQVPLFLHEAGGLLSLLA